MNLSRPRLRCSLHAEQEPVVKCQVGPSMPVKLFMQSTFKKLQTLMHAPSLHSPISASSWSLLCECYSDCSRDCIKARSYCRFPPIINELVTWCLTHQATALKHVEEEINMAMQRRLAAADSNLRRVLDLVGVDERRGSRRGSGVMHVRMYGILCFSLSTKWGK